MDPPSLDLDGWRASLVEGFYQIVASQLVAKNAPLDSRFVKLVEVPDISLSSTTSKFKAVALHKG